jgi:5-hydroxyisourate hydrolase
MPGISIHVVDISRGVPGAGMKVAVFHGGAKRRTEIAAGAISSAGSLDDARIGGMFVAGYYEVDFHVGAYYAGVGVTVGAIPFLDVVTYRFGIADPAQHYHVPFKCTPWGYSCFRGGV